MNRRTFVRKGALAGIGLTSLSMVSCLRAEKTRNEVPHFEPGELSVSELQEMVKSGHLTYARLTNLYLTRIHEIDKNGPQLNSIIEINPDAPTIAERMDQERKEGKFRGPLHGIPVLLKDNIDTGDKMQTTAGSLALRGNIAKIDAPLVKRLREAGAVILGKTNLSEWANFRSTRAASGWSSRGGLTKNPYLLDRSPCGSSSGSAVAVAANLCAIAIGTETDGSIACPASMNGVIGIKPTVGIVSRTGIIPISRSQDTAGPLARTVTDAVLLLNVLKGTDPKDQATLKNADPGIDYTKFLRADGLQGKRIGVEKTLLKHHEGVDKLLEKALMQIQQAGATIVEVEFLNKAGELGNAEFEMLKFEFKDGIDNYLAAANCQMKSLEDIIRFNTLHESEVMPYFKQEIMDSAVVSGGLQDKGYQPAIRKLEAYKSFIDEIFLTQQLDALCGPATGPAWCSDVINGDFWTGYGSYTPAAITGYPCITVPMGFVSELPVGLSFFGKAFCEAAIIEIGYAYEQVSLNRRPPKFLSSI